MNIVFEIDNQNIRRTDTNTVAANSLNYLSAVFSFDSSWDKYEKKAVFEKNGHAYRVPLESDSCKVAAEVLTEGVFSVSVTGNIPGNDEVRATTNTVGVSVAAGPSLAAENAAEPTPLEIERIEAIAQSALDAADAVSESAANGEFTGKTGNAATIEIGTVTSGDAPSVSNSGNIHAAVLNFVLQKGDTGDAGESCYSLSKTSEIIEHANSTTATSMKFLWLGAQTDFAYRGASNTITLEQGGIYSGVGIVRGENSTTFFNMTKNASLLGPAGLSVSSAAVNGTGELVLTMSDSTTINAGSLGIPETDYRLIRTFTVTSDDAANNIQGFSFDTDTDGNALALSSICIYATIPALESGTAHLEVGVKNSDNLLKGIYKRASVLTASGESIKIDLDLKGYWTGYSVSLPSCDENAQAITSYGTYGTVSKNSVSCKASYISVAASVALPTGTTIKIYGR